MATTRRIKLRLGAKIPTEKFGNMVVELEVEEDTTASVAAGNKKLAATILSALTGDVEATYKKYHQWKKKLS